MNSVEAIGFVARRLGPLADSAVFVGGAILPLLVDTPGAPPPRATRDVDVILEILSRAHYTGRLRQELRRQGFTEDSSASAPTCRWIVEGLRVDIMPADGKVLGLPSRWFPATLAGRVRHALPGGESVWRSSAPDFLAMKLDAFADRGSSDYRASHDLEDCVTVLDGRSSIEREIAGCAPAVRNYLSTELIRLLDTAAFRESVPGHLSADPGSQARIGPLLGRMKRIAEM